MLNIEVLDAFDDNYIFIIRCEGSNEVAVVDPGCADTVFSALKAGEKVTTIVLTHHHGDHVGGVQALCDAFNCDVYGAKDDIKRLPCVNKPVMGGDCINILGADVQVLSVPGHTLQHVAYYFSANKWLFCGDTLFVGGCGRLFEGSPSQMFNSMVKLKTLPDDVQVYCAHEYTVSNYKFALTVDGSALVQQAYEKAVAFRQAGKRTVPSTIGVEKACNVFMRAKTVEEFARLRRLKDDF